MRSIVSRLKIEKEYKCSNCKNKVLESSLFIKAGLTPEEKIDLLSEQHEAPGLSPKKPQPGALSFACPHCGGEISFSPATSTAPGELKQPWTPMGAEEPLEEVEELELGEEEDLIALMEERRKETAGKRQRTNEDQEQTYREKDEEKYFISNDGDTGNFSTDHSQGGHSSRTDTSNTKPMAKDRETGPTRNKQLESWLKVHTAGVKVLVDENLRGQVNQLVENSNLSFDDIDSIEYVRTPPPWFEPISAWNQTLQKDGTLVFHADDSNRCMQGLQHVKEFPKNAVMLFHNVGAGQWHMKNCNFPIDIIFINNNMRALAIYRMNPESGLTNAPLGTKHALETHPGWAKSQGIDIGDAVLSESLSRKASVRIAERIKNVS